MKKYVLLFSVTLIIISAIIMSGFFIENNSVDVDIIILSPQTVKNTVLGQGKVQYGTEKTITVDENCIIDEIFVDDGDTVKKGEPLYSYYTVEPYQDVIAQYSDAVSLYSQMQNSPIVKEAVSQIAKQSELKTIYSDTDGTVSDVSLSDSDYAVKNTDILKISDKSSMNIPININETSISKIKTGQKAEITFTAFADKKYIGTVTAISDEAKQTTGLTGKETSVEVTITPDKDIDNLRAGYTASCSVITSTEKNVLIVPYESIRTDDDGEYVYIVNKAKAKKKYVKTAAEYKDGILVKSGINDGEMLIKNCDSVSDGQKITLADDRENDDV